MRVLINKSTTEQWDNLVLGRTWISDEERPVWTYDIIESAFWAGKKITPILYSSVLSERVRYRPVGGSGWAHSLYIPGSRATHSFVHGNMSSLHGPGQLENSQSFSTINRYWNIRVPTSKMKARDSLSGPRTHLHLDWVSGLGTAKNHCCIFHRSWRRRNYFLAAQLKSR